MKQAIIDIGSNSMRLTLYETDGMSFKILFREKIMAGLAGYVENGVLSDEGIECACNGLLDFKWTLESLGIMDVAVFATASLRNISNTEEAITKIKSASDLSVEIISGKDEALFGYIGAMQELQMADGAFVDIGGASTELAAFENARLLALESFQVGSLNLYRECVKKILPGEASLKRMKKVIEERIDKKSLMPFDKRSTLVCVGGTARAVFRIARKLYSMTGECCSVSKEQLDGLCSILYKGDRTAADLILKLDPDRIHTIVPGVMIMQHIFKRFDAEEIVVSKYGVREGYLCHRMLEPAQKDMHTPKTGN